MRPTVCALRRIASLIVVLALVLASATAAYASVTSGFDAGLDGWRVTGDNAMTWSSTGGNPGGCLAVNDLATGDNNLSVAPPAFLGDWRAMTTADSLVLDVRFVNTSSGVLYYGPYFFRISGPGGAATALTGTIPPQGAWTSIGIALDPTLWVMESGTWSQLLANVNTVLIESEYVTGDESVWLDNVRLTGNVHHVIEPCVVETFDTDLADWSFLNTGGITNPGSGGNAGGFCRVADGSGASYAYAPSRFLGDWSSFAASGVFTIDVRLVSASAAPVDIAEFIRLSGPGGTASVPMPAASLPPAGRLWRTFAFALDGSAWTVSSGTWAALLANVTECRIQAEFTNATEVVGLDNVGRLLPACGTIDEEVSVIAPGLSSCGRIGYSGVSTVAHDPASGELYGTVDLASGSDGGLVALTGTLAGTRLQAYDQPTHVLFDAAGNAYVTEDNSGNVYRRTSAGVSSLWVSGFHTGDDDPSGMCIAPAGFSGPNVAPGDVLVTDWGYSGADEIWAFSTAAAEGERQVMADPGEVDIHDITIGPANSVWFADALDGTSLWQLAPNGTRTALPLSREVLGMVSLAYDGTTNRFYAAVTDSQRLVRIDPTNGNVVVVAIGFTGFSTCVLEIDDPGRRLWVADFGAYRVYEFCLSPTLGVENDAPAAAVAGGVVRSLAVAPNPARGATSVRLALARDADVRVDVLDAAGRLVRSLASGTLRAGSRTLAWDGRGLDGARVAPGVYLVSARSGSEVRTVRVAVLR